MSITASFMTSFTTGCTVLITGGTHVGHSAEVLGVTQKMIHVKLDNGIITKVKKCNARVTEQPSAEPLRAPRAMNNHRNPAQTVPAGERIVEVLPTHRHDHQPNYPQTQLRLEYERVINAAAAEIHRQATIVAEFTERLRQLDLNRE